MEEKDWDEIHNHHETGENYAHEKNPHQAFQGPTKPTDEINTTPEKGKNDHLSDLATDEHESRKKAAIEALRDKFPDKLEETIQFFANNTPLDSLKTLIELHLQAK